MTRGKDTLTIKEVETSKTRKDKTKAESKGTNLIAESSLLGKMQDIKKAYNNSIVAALRQLSPTLLLEFLVFPTIIQYYKPSSEEDELLDQDKSVESPSIVSVSNVEKEEDSRDVKECMRRIDSLVEVLNEKVEEENTEKEAAKKKFAKNIVNAPEVVGTNTDNLERDAARLAKAVEVTSEEHHNSLAIVVYVGPLKVTPPTQEVANDAEAELEPEK
ncbi:hypothetical protein PVK06_043098 [Gossypium arboreum]|uniref:Uncharacterized protein n=1 Tax=Gossypium arboreum TaxID=29729 RepID=A0ABR0MMN2_GOSAR|nr:hypothetical protein PVK06_043098 [Gossypium arboreum]